MADEMLIKVTWPGNTFVPAICSGIANRLWQIDGNTRQINQNIFYLSAKDIYEKSILIGYFKLSGKYGKLYLYTPCTVKHFCFCMKILSCFSGMFFRTSSFLSQRLNTIQKTLNIKHIFIVFYMQYIYTNLLKFIL